MWNIEKIISKGDYNYCIVRNHPNRTKNDYVLHHRIVMENYLGRLLTSDEIVHHKNGNKKDNRIENLEVLSDIEHAALHGKEKTKNYAILKCPVCNKIFIKEKRNTHLSKKHSDCTCCSGHCGTFLGRLRQLNRITSDLQKHIDKNIICIYKA